MVMQKGDEIIGLVDDVTGQVFRNTDELTDAGKMIFAGDDGAKYALDGADGAAVI